MITFLDGKLVNALPTQAIVDVGGVGYEVFIPLSSYDKLPAAGQSIRPDGLRWRLTFIGLRRDWWHLLGTESLRLLMAGRWNWMLLEFVRLAMVGALQVRSSPFSDG